MKGVIYALAPFRMEQKAHLGGTFANIFLVGFDLAYGSAVFFGQVLNHILPTEGHVSV